jgi:hypothetical protein
MASINLTCGMHARDEQDRHQSGDQGGRATDCHLYGDDFRRFLQPAIERNGCTVCV